MQNDIMNASIQYGGIIFWVITMIFIYIFIQQGDAISSKNIGNLFLALFSFVFVFAVSMQIWKSTSSFIFFISMFFILGFVYLICYFYFQYITTTPTKSILIYNILLTILFGFILLVGLAVVFYMFRGRIMNLDGWTGFMVKLIFFIPCLFAQLLEYFLEQYKITPNIIFILFFIEVFLIILFVYSSSFVKSLLTYNSIVLVDEPQFLDTKRVIAVGEGLAVKEADHDYYVLSGSSYNSYIFRSNYAISMWVFMNPRSVSLSKEINIFDYGFTDNSDPANPVRYMKPKISYKYDITQDETGKQKHKDKYIVYFTSDILNKEKEYASRYEIEIPNQKWNHFVFNYNDNQADLFLNGKLIRSFQYKYDRNPPKYSLSDQITIGDDNGNDGAISAVMFHKSPLSQAQIANIYNMNVLRNPPQIS